ncbi:MAG: hypothetical protein CL878_07030 [Dehalococcoidia bacterium]|nr:hypothetical protein [Dehalococcoidia bacterium]
MHNASSTRPLANEHAEPPVSTQQSAGSAGRLGRLYAATSALTVSYPDETILLQRIVEQVVRLVNARYAALALLDPDGALSQFVTTGLTADEQAQLASTPPEGHGILGAMLREGEPLRLEEISHDPRSAGFPSHHPDMHTFLGVPLLLGTRVVGRIYMTDREDGPFTEEDENLALGFAAAAAVAIENARLYREASREISQRRQAQEELRLANSRLRREISEREQAEAALWQAKNEAERASNAKSDLLSGMSHELRTPMNAILGFAQLLDVDPSEPLSADQKECADQILMAGERLQGQIDKILDLSQIEQGHFTLSPEAVVLRSLVAETLATVEPMAGQRRVTLEDQTAALGGTAIWADGSRVQQVLLNLLTNAIRYNRLGGTVTLSAALVDASRLRLSVRDTGQGISATRLPSLLEPLNRAAATETEADGISIGLTVTKQLLDLMGGSIAVESVEGEGSTFTIELPRAEAAAAAERIAPA